MEQTQDSHPECLPAVLFFPVILHVIQNNSVILQMQRFSTAKPLLHTQKTNMRLILASNSPRRRELLGGLDIPYEVHVIKGIDESYPASLPAVDVAGYIAKKKAMPYKRWFEDIRNVQEGVMVGSDTIVVTADTVVVVDDVILGKPSSREDAANMLRTLSGKTHQVYTGVCLLSPVEERGFSVRTDVTFRNLSEEEITYYIDKYQPFDKAGAYGIQEWIGYIGVTKLEGSYFNVMGLPVQRINDELKMMAHLLQ